MISNKTTLSEKDMSHKKNLSCDMSSKSVSKNKQKRSKILPTLIMLLGIIFILYPVIATQWNNAKQIKVLENYIELAEKQYNTKSIQINVNDELESARKYNQTRTNAPILDPWLSRIATDNEPYNEYLKQLSSLPAMGRIVIPSIKADMLIYHGISEDVLQIGVGHLFGTDLPIGGDSTHAVLSGHTGLANATLFDNLIKVKKGQSIYLSVAGQRLKYKIHQTRVVLPSETSNLEKIEGKDLLTLITCTPYGINSHRLLVHAHRVPIEPNDNVLDTKPTLQWQWWMIVSLIASAVILSTIFYWLFGGKRKKKQDLDNKPEIKQNSLIIKRQEYMMTANKLIIKRKLRFFTIVLLVFLTLIVILTSSRVMANTITGDISKADINLIDTQRLSSIKVTKTHPNPYNEIKKGEKIPEPPEGVNINISKIADIDLKTKNSWEKAQHITLDEARKRIEFTKEGFTDKTGSVKFDNLPVGLYLIEEKFRQGNYKVEKTRPVLITVPTVANKVYAENPTLKWAYEIQITLKPEGKKPTDTSVIPNPISKIKLNKILKLSMTGADIAMYSIVGILLVGTGVWFVIVGRRKNNKEEVR